MAKISIDLKSGKLEKKQTVIGIDLGTTNSLIATVENGTPTCIEINGKSTLPSAIHFSGDSIEVGSRAISKMVADPENTLYSIKRLLGKSYKDLDHKIHTFNYSIIDEEDKLVKVKSHGKYYSPIQLSSFILKELKTQAEQALNSEVNKVVITVPAYFNDSQRQATRDAGKLAGLDVLRIINEPTAASLAYGFGVNNDSKNTIAVFDLGGGTFDISILAIQNGIFEVLATNGNTYLGGDDIDQNIVKHWVEKHNLGKLSKSEKQQLRLLAEDAKIKLGSTAEVSYQTSINNATVNLALTVKQLNELIEPLIKETLDCSTLALQDANLNLSDIQEVVLVGGSTKNKFIQKKVGEFFKQSHINNTIDPDEIVAKGAAIEADILAGNRTDMLLLDVTPLSLGIETLGGLMDVIVPRNSKIPTKVKKTYSTSVDGQINLKISVYQGERELVGDNRKLGEFILANIPAMPAGLPQIEVSFLLNADGILKVSAKELRSNTLQEVELKPQYGLTDKEMNDMLKESIEFSKQDLEARALIEAIESANTVISSTKKFLKNESHLTTEVEKVTIENLIASVEQSINDKEKDTIIENTEILNEHTKPYAEIVMNKSISNALKGKKI
jgi:molecular chaperone HscA